MKGYAWLGAIVLALLLLKSAGGLPEFLDELPLHLEKSSIDTLGDAGKEAYTELVPFGLMLDHTFEYMREELGVSVVTRFISRRLKELIDIFDNILRGGSKGLGLGAPPWTALMVIAFILGYSHKGWKLAILSGGTVMYFAIFGL